MTLENSKQHARKFIFAPKRKSNSGEAVEKVEVVIPELLQPGYSFYTWPSAPVLANFLYQRRVALKDKKILEIGSGTSLPGILAAKLGAKVILSDSATLPKTIEHIQKCCYLNNLAVGKQIRVIGLTWGLLLNNLLTLGPLDLIIASDCFYDPTVFEEILFSVSFLLAQNPHCKFIFSYQERSTDWSLDHLLRKWDLKCNRISGVEASSLDGAPGHTIHLFEITHK